VFIDDDDDDDDEIWSKGHILNMYLYCSYKHNMHTMWRGLPKSDCKSARPDLSAGERHDVVQLNLQS
jgi:hypothetical protein